jgi:hypothetical protein
MSMVSSHRSRSHLKQQAQKTRSKWCGSDQIVVRGSHSAAKGGLFFLEAIYCGEPVASLSMAGISMLQILNHNFQPQRSHLNRSSGFALDAGLPQRGHLIVQI